MRRFNPLLLVLTLGACSDEAFAEGAICPAPAVLADFADGDDLEVEVLFDDCLPGCGGDTRVSCDVSRKGSTIELDAYGSYRPRGGNGGCATVCKKLVVTCVLGDLPAGTYDIHSGSHALELTVPSDDPPAYEALCGYD